MHLLLPSIIGIKDALNEPLPVQGSKEFRGGAWSDMQEFRETSDAAWLLQVEKGKTVHLTDRQLNQVGKLSLSPVYNQTEAKDLGGVNRVHV
jgi:hypothetical protein